MVYMSMCQSSFRSQQHRQRLLLVTIIVAVCCIVSLVYLIETRRIGPSNDNEDFVGSNDVVEAQGGEVMLGIEIDNQVEELFAPLHLGLSRKEVRALFPDYQECLILVQPSQLASGGEVLLTNGIVAQFAFNQQDVVDFVSSKDTRVRLANGVGVGSNYGAVVAVCTDSVVVRLDGYGTMVQVSHCVQLGLGCTSDEPKPDSVIEWIELRCN